VQVERAGPRRSRSCPFARADGRNTDRLDSGLVATTSSIPRPIYSTERLARSRFATAVVFVLLGLLVGVLAARMPAIKSHAQLSDGMLGLALLGMPIGSIASIQVTGRAIARWGSSPLTSLGIVVMAVAVVAPPFATGFPTLLMSLMLFGVGVGFTDTAMNAHAVTVEQGYRRPIMSSFHGFASLGQLVGAVGGAFTAHLGISPKVYFLAAGAATLVGGLIVRAWLLPGAADTHQPGEHENADHRAPWSRTLILLAAVAFLSLLAELAVGDWSAVYLRDNLGTAASVATYGYALFSLAMVCTRFFADRAIARLGSARVLGIGGLAAGIALSVGLVTDNVAGLVIAWGVVGIGMAGVVPIVFSTTGNLPGVPAGGALSKVVGVGYTGSLLGPPLIGLSAEATTLKTALFLIAAACLTIGIIGPMTARRAARST
jgi:MFS family permease